MNQQIVTTEQSTPPRSRQSSIEISRQHMNLQKIIESNEEIIYQQGKIITNLSLELGQLQKSNGELARRLEILSELVGEPLDEKSIRERNQKLIQKIQELQQRLVRAKIESATKQSQILNAKHELKKLKSQPNRKSFKVQETNFDTLSKSKIVNLIEKDTPTKLEFNNHDSIKEIHYSESEIKQWLKYLQINQPFKSLRNKKIKEKTKSIIKKYIPKELRSKAWPIFIENKLALAKTFYDDLIQTLVVPEKIRNQIEKDIQRSFPYNEQFNNNKKLLTDLQQLLQLFHSYRPDISYVQGMTYPATILLMAMDKQKAFKCFCNIIITNQFVRNLYSFNIKKISLYCRTFDQILEENIPWLAEKLQELNLNSEIYLIEWFYTFFSRTFSLPMVFKIWDLFIYYGELIFFRLAYAIFDHIKGQLQTKDYQNCISTIKNFGKFTTEQKLLEAIHSNKLNQEKLYNIMNNVNEYKRSSLEEIR